MSGRPQNENLINLNDRSPEEAHAIRSAGGKAAQEKRRRQKQMAELLQIYSELPILKGKAKSRLEKLGIADEDLTQKALVADALMQEHGLSLPLPPQGTTNDDDRFEKGLDKQV